MRDLVVATGNRGKLEEIRAALQGLDFRLLSADEVGGLPEVEEDGDTLLMNAQKKARSAALHTGLLSLADDTGLEVEALGGAPGVWSARWAGPGCSYDDNNRKLLAELAALGPGASRRAIFRTVLALCEPRGKEKPAREDWVAGWVEGEIAPALCGENGFGYDPLFIVGSSGKTLAQMTLEEKNRYSHRGAALRRLRQVLERW